MTESPAHGCTATGRRWHRSEAWRTLRRLARTAVPTKANTLHPHDLRHAFVTLSLKLARACATSRMRPATLTRGPTRRYDRAGTLDRHPTYALAGLLS